MSNIQGINIAAPVAPYTTDDVYPSHFALYGKGGWRTVATLAERNAIPFDRLELGMIVCVLDTGMRIKKRFELTGLTGTFTSFNSVWSELTVAGSATWGNIGGNVADQTDLFNLINTKALKVNPFSAGSFLKGDYVSYRTGTYVFKNNTSISQLEINTDGEFAVFRRNSENLGLIYHERKLDQISVGAAAPVNIAQASTITDYDIVATASSVFNITLTAGEILVGGELILFATLYAGQRLIFGSGFKSADIAVDSSLTGVQNLVLMFKADPLGTEYRLLNAPSKSYDTTALKVDLQTILGSGTNSTVNIVANATEGPSIQTAVKDWSVFQSYRPGSLVKYEGLIFRCLAPMEAGESSVFVNGYVNAWWDYVCHASTHRFFYTLDLNTFGWDFTLFPVVNLTSGTAPECMIIPSGYLFSGMDLCIVYRRMSAQKLVFDPSQFSAIPDFPEWTGTEQMLVFNFRTIRSLGKIYYETTPVSSGNPVTTFSGVFNATTRSINLPAGTKSLVFFGMDNHSFVNPENYTLDLVSVPQKLIISGELDTLVSGDHYWGTVLTVGAFISASPTLSINGTQLSLTTGSGTTTVDLGGVKMNFSFGVGYSNTYNTVVTAEHARTYTKTYSTNTNTVSFFINTVQSFMPLVLTAGDTFSVTITRTDISFGSAVTIAT